MTKFDSLLMQVSQDVSSKAYSKIFFEQPPFDSGEASRNLDEFSELFTQMAIVISGQIIDNCNGGND